MRGMPSRLGHPRLYMACLWASLVCLLLLLAGCTSSMEGGASPPGSDPTGEGSSPETTNRDGAPGTTSGRPGPGGEATTTVPRPTGIAPPTTLDALGELEDLARRELEQGTIAYNPPEKMRDDETAIVEVRITRGESPELGSSLQGPGQARIEKLWVGALMRTELRSSDFDITERRPAVQPLWKEGHRSWLWDIKPRRSGNLTLSLVVSVIYEGETLEFKALDRMIRVDVTTKSWMTRNGPAALGTAASLVAVISAVVAFMAWLRRSRAQKPKSPST
jgi:hypothetical protein